ncbi:MAG TPA: ABC transporter permease, partial [Steroidobacteraceae bacterium]|nr:ABC transporter permease [Steroidobacteraceae bacterium]
LFIASRYLRARRKHTVVSVITVISVVGVAAGVMALVIAMAVTTGFNNQLQRSLLGAMAHINVVPRVAGEGIEDWRSLMARLRAAPHVTAAAPALYSPVLIAGPVNSKAGWLKGIDVPAELEISETLRKLDSGSLDRLRDPDAKPPGLILGKQLAHDAGIRVGNRIEVLSPEGGEMNPMYGMTPTARRFVATGIFSSGFYEFDESYAYASIAGVQKMLGQDDVVNAIELKVDDLNRAPEIARDLDRMLGPHFTATSWQEQNNHLFDALRGERIVTIIIIGLIELVAALNILIVLVMMVMEKYRDIAILMSMGARREQIRRIFMMQGVLIGVVGSAIGLTVGYTLCYFAEKYKWIRIDESVYAFAYVPFETHWVHAIWIAAAAILISFLATLYPARNATRISPAEVLRYE